MFPQIDMKQTGINIRRIMDERGFTVKDIQKYLGLGSVQSVYHWLNGISLPTVDHLYALSGLFHVSIDEMLQGNRSKFVREENRNQMLRLRIYYNRMNKFSVA